MTFRELANQHLFQVPIYEPGKPIEEVARELGLDPDKIDKIASNENPLGPSPKAIKAMRRAIREAHIYPDGASFELRSAIARKQGLDYRNVIVGNGSEEVLKFLAQGFLSPDKEAIMADRGFAIFRIVTQIVGAKPIEVPMRNHTHDLDAMLAAVTPRTRLIFVANPNNPTGTRVSNESLYSFFERLPDHVVAVIDEAYYEFLDNPPDTVRWVREANPKKKIVAVRTFSKIAGLAGLRVGYGLAPVECAQVLERTRSVFNINSIAQAAALAALDDAEFIEKTRRLNARGRDWLARQFTKLKLEFLPSEGNFILVRLGNGREMFAALQKRGVIIRPMDGYRMPEWVRVSVGTMPQNRRFIRALKEELKQRLS